jgi:hypothetical protein
MNRRASTTFPTAGSASPPIGLIPQGNSNVEKSPDQRLRQQRIADHQAFTLVCEAGQVQVPLIFAPVRAVYRTGVLNRMAAAHGQVLALRGNAGPQRKWCRAVVVHRVAQRSFRGSTAPAGCAFQRHGWRFSESVTVGARKATEMPEAMRQGGFAH